MNENPGPSTSIRRLPGVDPSLVAVIPVFEDAEAASELLERLCRVIDGEIHLIVVDDGSVLRPFDAGAIARAGLEGTALHLRRNVGHQCAIAVGLHYVAANLKGVRRILVMDGDGEDRPEDIPTLLEALELGSIDVAVAERRNRVESGAFRLFYLIYRMLFWLLTGRTIRFGNFMVMKPGALVRIVAMRETWTHLAAGIMCSRLRIRRVPLDRGKRYCGDTKFSFSGLALHGFRSLMVFAEDVLVRVGVACAVVAAFTVVGGLVTVALKLLGYATPGWFSVALGILLLVFLQTGALTLMTLMLAGVVRRNVISTMDHRAFIDRIERAGRAQPAA